VLLDDIARALTGERRSQTEKSSIRKSGAIMGRLRGGQGTASRLWQYGVYGLWGVGIVYQLLRHSWEHLTLDLFLVVSYLFLGSALLFLWGTSSSTYERVLARLVVLCAFPVAAWGCHSLAVRWHRDFVRHYDSFYACGAFTSLARIDPGSERICVCDYRYYPFFGSRRQYHVCRPLWLPEYSRFLEYVQGRKITLLAASHRDVSAQERYVYVKQWIAAHPELFHPFHEDSRYTIVRVNRSQAQAARVSSPLASRPLGP
jgi:hypothetical protein